MIDRFLLRKLNFKEKFKLMKLLKDKQLNRFSDDKLIDTIKTYPFDTVEELKNRLLRKN